MRFNIRVHDDGRVYAVFPSLYEARRAAPFFADAIAVSSFCAILPDWNIDNYQDAAREANEFRSIQRD